MNQSYIKAGVFLVGAMLTGCQPPSGVKTPAQKDKAPHVVVNGEINLQKLDGSGVAALSDLRGKPVILYFMAPWTDSGKASLSWLETADLGGVEIVPVVVDQRPSIEQDGELNSRLATLGSFTATPEIMNAVGGIRALPTAVYLNAEGEVVKKWQGAIPPGEMAADLTATPGTNPSAM